MALDPQQLASPSPPPAGPRHVADKVRIRFRKDDDLRLVSHHDLMKCFERLLRRAALPFHATQGFNPKPRLVFALSLALGIVGCEEVVELELDEQVPPEEVHERLARHAPPGLKILSVRRIDRKVTAQVRRACYRLAVPPERSANLPERIAALLAAPECWVERTRGARRIAGEGQSASPSGAERPPSAHTTVQSHSLDLRPFLQGLRLSAGSLEMDVWVTPTGTARPAEILALLGLEDLLEAGVVLQRSTLELHDEVQETDSAPQSAERRGQPARVRGHAHAQPEALLPGPLSFDS